MSARLTVLSLAVAIMAALLTSAAAPQSAIAGTTGAVFTMTNGSSKNKVLIWSRAATGALNFVAGRNTGGRGNGGFLDNQGGLALVSGWLYAVNAGSHSVSVFRASGTNLSRTDVQPVGANRPISVAARGTLVYVLHTGGGGGVRGFRRDANGGLTPIAGSTRQLSGNGVVPAQVGFSRDGAQLLVTERATDKITRYRVNADGSIQAPVTTNSAGPEPFGFDTAPDGTLVVSEAGNHVEDGSSASSYRFNGSGTPVVVSDAVGTTETAACWVAITPNGNFAYVTNTPDNSISGFAISGSGSLTLLSANGVTAATGASSFPIDLDTSRDGEYLYVLLAGTHRIATYQINGNGSLTTRGSVGGLPASANGLVAR